ncbi:MAG TPA: alpha-amylase family glycosyl hydrolase [Polyangiaceae bacterium]|jgi:cyclomaltodextrin glucanotransferase|nr:alpha-amylase family glycosyl hydrolase [Polyangiaceae bacterium]
MVPVTMAAKDSEVSDDAARSPTHGVTDIEFRGEVIYFIVVDRFHQGVSSKDPSLDKGLSDPARKDWGKYWGGDLQGVIDQLDYLQKLGVTAVWLTPLFEQIEAMAWEAAPIHGYWARDFKRLNPHFVAGTDEVRVFARNDTTFDRLVTALHDRGMKLVLDIVCNHSSPDVNGAKGQLFDDGKLVADFNDDAKNWYHHYGPVQDWSSDWQVKNCELAGLATFNENNDDYRRYMKGAIRAWLDKGVDALRVDTVKHMPLWFWQEFTSDMVSHRPDVFMFGEWIFSHPSIEPAVEFANKSGMTILDFGLCLAIRGALGSREAAGFHLVADVLALDKNYRFPSELVTFLDNHDMPRFQSLGADGECLGLGVALIMLGRGTPCLYYGTEQYLHDDTNGGNDPYNRPMMPKFDTDTPLFVQIRKLADLRRKNAAVQFGSQWNKYLTPDIYCFSRRYGGSRCFVALNRGDTTVIETVETDLPNGSHRCALSGRSFNVDHGRIAGLELGARSALVLSVEAPPVEAKAIVRFQINRCPTQPGEFVAITGDCPELGEWELGRAYRLEYINDNLWQMGLPFQTSAGKVIAYKYVILSESDGALVPKRENRSTRRRVVPAEGLAKWRDAWED